MQAVAAFLLVLCHLAVTQAWYCEEAPRMKNAYQVDAGNGMVVVRDTNSVPYFLIGNTWHRLSDSYTRLSHVSAGGAGIWGTYYHHVYKYVGGKFEPAYGPYMQQVDAGANTHLVGTSLYSSSFCLRGDRAQSYRGSYYYYYHYYYGHYYRYYYGFGYGYLSWSYLGHSAIHYSCGRDNQCWGVDSYYRVFYTKSVTSMCARTQVRYVYGPRMKMIEVGSDGSVFGVGTDGKVYQRTGISISHPSGLGWTDVPPCIATRSVSSDLGFLWVVSKGGTLMKCRE